ncbi:MAG TPA: carboxypeptidase-like regulatory domain-containing protein [Gemmatimonadaceae bacterium]|nr:carboxypeptidase-like regulatory domain-containing protein [Gemmatimonadaceae bacterium]
MRDRPLIRAIACLGAASCLCLAVPVAAARAQHPQVIQGRVTTDSGAALPAADIIVTIAPTAETITDKSDSSGAYRVVIPKPTGEYILYIGALGRKPFRQRVTIKPPDTVAVVNAKLAPAVTQVAAMRVQARKARPRRSMGSEDGFGTDPTDKSADGVNGALSPDMQGNLDAMASLIPGLSTSPNGVSAFGLGGDNNSTTLNGLAFSGGDLPRDARTTTRFRTSPWDPTIGGFNGVQTAVTLSSGGNISRRSGHVTLDAPQMQFSDPVASRAGQKFANVALDEGGQGAYKLDAIWYNFGAHFARQTASTSSLLDLDPGALTRAGISPDSAAHLISLLQSMHVPVTTGGIPDARTTTTASFIERIDRAPAPPTKPNGPPGATLALTGFGRYSLSQASSLSPTALPAFSGKTTNAMAGIQGLYSTYFGHDGDYLSETTTSLSFNDNRGTPYVELPSGSVLVASDLGNGASGLGSLAFGGNSALQSNTNGWTWETINQTDFLLRGKQNLPMKIYLQSRFDGFDQTVAANRLGRYSFASLADVANNTPTSFSRTLNAPSRSGGEWIGAGAVGGNFSFGKVSLMGGVRVDANAFTAAPAYNASVDQLFGARTDHAPSGVSFSPRVGFTWLVKGQRGFSMMMSPMAVVSQGPIQLRGGVGKFQGVFQPTLLADALSSTGLAGSTQQLLCIGSAAPTPNWQAFSSDPSAIPDQCAGGAANFADTARAVTLFDRRYAPPESWRENLGVTTDMFWTHWSVDASYSLNLHQPGMVDLNFAGSPRFALANEGNRPVFVAPTSIVASTGAISAVDARAHPEFGRVADRVSDLRGDAKQLAVYAIPDIPFRIGILLVGYTYSDARVQGRGFDQSTSGDPRTMEWSMAPFTPRHQLTAQFAHTFHQGRFGASGLLKVQSGFPFTPIVAGDINGDGASNDRAFVFDPASADPSVASGLRALMASGPAAARNCLSAQMGQIAARNSCVGPWSATANANFAWFRVPHTDNRASLFLSFANLAGGIDELLHGSNRLHGWGMFPLPDPMLYQVRGFDQNAKRFLYEVNPRFGSTSPATTTRRSPFRITLDLSLTLGRSPQEQQVEQNIRVKPHLVGTRATADTIKERFMKQQFSDIYAIMLHFADSLALSRDQVDAMQAEQKVLRAEADSIYAGLAAYLVGLPASYDVPEAAKHVTQAGDSVWNRIYAEKAFLVKTLTPGQLRLLPSPLRAMIEVPDFKGRFFFGF